MKLVYERDTTHNYMIPQGDIYIAENDYRVHMLMENQIRGLLQCGLRKKDGTEEFRYDITSRQSLEHLYSGRCMGEEEIRILMQGLFLMLAELKKYLLDASMLVLEPQMIYLDVETREPAFCYLPGYKKDIMVSFQELSVYVLQHLDMAKESTVLLGYRIYREASEENYCLDRLLRAVVIQGEKMTVQNSNSENETERRKKELDRTDQVYTTAENENFYRKKTDVMQWQEEVKKETYSFDEVEKQTSLGNGKKGISQNQKKEKLKQEQRKEKMRRNKEKTQKKIEKSKQENRKKEAEKQKFTGKMFLMICFALALIMTLVAAWLWKLTITQTGGIIFLLVGLMAYGCSLEPKKVSAGKEEIDYGSYGLEEQPYIIEERKSGQEVQEEKTQKYSEQWMQDQQEFCRKSEIGRQRMEKERLGDTTVLYERNLEEEPLMLTRINSQNQEYLVLLQDQYTVGKLNTEADFVIQDSSVSRIHAKIQRRNGAYFVRDLNSTNGTFLNERRLMINERVRIQPGDMIAFARAQYRVERC